MATESDGRRLALGLPHVTERPSHGTPAFYVAGRIFARMHEEPGVLTCWCRDLDEREALLSADPQGHHRPLPGPCQRAGAPGSRRPRRSERAAVRCVESPRPQRLRAIP